MPQQESIQYRSLLAYLEICAIRPHWQRRLIAITAAEVARPFAFAATAAGAAVLWLDEHADAMREASQSSVIDFSVDSLSEALRILKNEIRKGLPISVGVSARSEIIYQAMAERGVQPDLLFAEAQSGAAMLQRRGALRIADPPSAAELDIDVAANWRHRQAQDSVLLRKVQQLGSSEGAIAERWLRAAPRLFPRDLCRPYPPAWLPLSKDVS